jgi:hypothetical protein
MFYFPTARLPGKVRATEGLNTSSNLYKEI